MGHAPAEQDLGAAVGTHTQMLHLLLQLTLKADQVENHPRLVLLIFC